MTDAMIDRELLLTFFEDQGTPETRQLVERALVEGGMAEQTHFAQTDMPRVLNMVVELSRRDMLARAAMSPDSRDDHAFAILDMVQRHALPLLKTELSENV